MLRVRGYTSQPRRTQVPGSADAAGPGNGLLSGADPGNKGYLRMRSQVISDVTSLSVVVVSAWAGH